MAIRSRVAILALTWASAAIARAASDPIQDALFKKPYVDIDEWREKAQDFRQVQTQAGERPVRSVDKPC